MESALQPAAEWPWRFIADTVMGGVSQGQAELVTAGGQRVLRLTGEVSTANRGGFIQAQSRLAAPPEAGVEGVAIRVRGNGERYFLHLRTAATLLPWQYYQAGFGTGPDWQEIRLPLTAFEGSGRLLPRRIAPESIRSVGLVAYGRDHVADVSLAAIGFY
ncbi:NADH ubiquinone oxidoreductase [Tropicimonas sp. IMCC6043]|nr:NADH ubiquinone oxidoreductase [Tropicimonas sp. IMCC6043]